MFLTVPAAEIPNAARSGPRAVAPSALLATNATGTATTSAVTYVVVRGGDGRMGAPEQERGEEACKVMEEGKEGEKAEAGLRVAATSATANTTINPRG